jgi:hypothetical protein
MRELIGLSRDFWAWRAARQPVNYDDVQRVTRPAGWSPDWSPAAVEASRERLRSFRARWRALARPEAPIDYQVDHRLLGSALARVRWELDLLGSWRRNPGFYLAQTLGALVEALLPPPPFTAERGRDLCARLAAFPRLLADARGHLDQAARPFARLAVEDLEGIGPRLRRALRSAGALLDPDTRGVVERETEPAVEALLGFRSWLGARLDTMADDVSVGREAYLFFLRRVALIAQSPEEILRSAAQEWARSVAGEEIAGRRNRGSPALSLARDQEEQVARAREQEGSIRRLLSERALLTVPDWMPRYVYRAMPEYLEALSGFGEPTEFTSPERALQESARYIPPPSSDLAYFPLSMALDARPDMLHEGIPGHAFQLKVSWRHQDEVRRHWYDSGVNEGIGFYAEEMMLEAGLVDDSPRTREMLWSYLRLRALRVEVDVRLALGTFSLEQAAEFLRTAVPVDAGTARAEAAAFAGSPGFAIGYHVGKLQILRLLADLRRRQGSAFDLRAFHDSVWKNGNVPLALQRWELLGERDEIDELDAWTSALLDD